MEGQEMVVVPVRFTPQQRELIDRLKREEEHLGRTEGEIVRAVFARWLEESDTA
jgi:predicted DNA-binding protein